jgi:hypothetical protein
VVRPAGLAAWEGRLGGLQRAGLGWAWDAAGWYDEFLCGAAVERRDALHVLHAVLCCAVLCCSSQKLPLFFLGPVA